MRCRRCGNENPQNARRCMYCNAPLYKKYGANGNNKRYDRVIVALIVALSIVFLSIVGSYAFKNLKPSRFGISGGGGVGGSSGGTVVTPTDDSKGAFPLELSECEFVAGEGTKTVYFYARPKANASKVELTDDNGTVLAEMKDDGLYSQSGDDLQNDGVFTAMLQVDTSQEKALFYSAKANGEKSDTKKLCIIAVLTEEELSSIRKVDEALSMLRQSDTYKSLDVDGRRKEMISQLELFENEKIIIENSIHDDTKNNIITYCYSSGVMGVEELEDRSMLENGTGRGKADYKPFANTPAVANNIGDVNLGTAKIMYATDDTNSDRYTTAITQLQSDWNNRGLKTSVDSDVTLADMKALKGNDLVFVDAHGAYIEFEYEYDKEYTWFFKKDSKKVTVKEPGVIFREKTSSAKDKAYSLDLKSGRIFHSGGRYGIFPEFMNAHYNTSDLEGSIFIWSSCEFMGLDGAVNEKWTNAMNSRNVAAFVGYHNSVYAWYVYDMVSVIVPNLINGDTIQAAYNKAVTACGATDVAWYNAVVASQPQQDSFKDKFLKLIGLYEEKKAHTPAAYPLLRGDKNAMLVNLSLKNGTFDEDSSVPKHWEKNGDVRVITQLGEVKPTQGSQMAILSTGIGSGQSSYLNSTEGSSLYQTVKLPDDVSTLSFDYNVISEEPTEYVGSKFDDKFYAEILNANGKVIRTLASETINNSVWTPVSEINFDGGDNTVYQTGWKSFAGDITDLKGQVVTIRFVVFDVGDSKYDTAAVVDNVVLK